MTLSFRRFLSAQSFIEIAIDGATVWRRFGPSQLEVTVTHDDFDGADAARAHYDALVAGYEKKYEEDDAVTRSVSRDTKATQPAAREASSGALDPLRALYRRKLRDAKLAFGKPFVAQVRDDAASDDVARECIAIAEKVFGVEFARTWSNGTDEVSLEDDEFAAFYESPWKVQRIAERRLLGDLKLDDGER